MLPIRKALERAHGIVAQRRHAETLFFDCSKILLQLHELDFTERSPIRGAKKDQHRSFRSHDRFNRLRPAVLILRGKGWNLLTYLRTGLDVLPKRRSDRKGQQAEALSVFGIRMLFAMVVRKYIRMPKTLSASAC